MVIPAGAVDRAVMSPLRVAGPDNATFWLDVDSRDGLNTVAEFKHQPPSCSSIRPLLTKVGAFGHGRLPWRRGAGRLLPVYDTV